MYRVGSRALCVGRACAVWWAWAASLSHTRGACARRAQEGGGLYLVSGRVTLSNGSALRGNRAASAASNALFFGSGEATYLLPAPAGHWLSQAQCRVYRKACPVVQANGIYVLDPACQAARDRCALLPPTTPLREECTERAFVQPCNWEVAGQLGRALYQLPVQHVEGDLPSPCAPGVLGSADVARQGSAACAGPCPAGQLCPRPATVVPEPCNAGHYCPLGSALALPCPAGSYSSATNLANAAECSPCPLGHECGVGSTAPLKCAPGSYADELGLPACKAVPEGHYQAAAAASSYSSCEAGSYCPQGASAPLACPAGTYSGATDLASAEQCSSCSPGHACGTGSTAPLPCSAGSYAGSKGSAQCTLCAAGTYSSRASIECTPCAPGTYQPSAGGTECIACPVSADAALTSPAGSPLCTACADGFYRDGADQASLLTCRPCPPHATCVGDATLDAIAPLEGFWRLSTATSTIYACRGRSAGVPGPQCVGKAAADRQWPHTYCADGHEGPRCEVCTKPRHFFAADSGECAACNAFAVAGRAVAIAVGAAGIFGFVLLLAALIFKRYRPELTLWAAARKLVVGLLLVPLLKQLFGFYQIVGVLSTAYGVDLPNEYVDWMRSLALDFEAVVLPGVCVGGVRMRLVLLALIVPVCCVVAWVLIKMVALPCAQSLLVRARVPRACAGAARPAAPRARRSHQRLHAVASPHCHVCWLVGKDIGTCHKNKRAGGGAADGASGGRARSGRNARGGRGCGGAAGGAHQPKRCSTSYGDASRRGRS